MSLRGRHLLALQQPHPHDDDTLRPVRLVDINLSRSSSTFVKKRAYSRCITACSIPPTYWSTGIQSLARSASKGASSISGEVYRRKYHEESTKVSIVSVSRTASAPQSGQSTCFHSSAASSGFPVV